MLIARCNGAGELDPTLLDVEVDGSSVRLRGLTIAPAAKAPNEILPLGSALDWARRLPEAVDASAFEANLVVDARTPYSLVVPVLFTLGLHWIGRVNIVVRRGDGSLGALKTCRPMAAKGLWVRPADEGYAIALFSLRTSGPRASSQVYGRDCKAGAAGVAVPKRDGSYDRAGLTSCLQSIFDSIDAQAAQAQPPVQEPPAGDALSRLLETLAQEDATRPAVIVEPYASTRFDDVVIAIEGAADRCPTLGYADDSRD
jgi:hypothetical protein